MTPIQFWIVMIVISLIAEALTTSFFSIWFAAGAVCALIVKLLGGSFAVQMYIFAITSIIFILLSEFILKKKFHILKKAPKTNIDSIIGKVGIATKEINNIEGKGEVEIEGKRWTALSADDRIIRKKERVVIERVEGVKLIVRKKEH